LLLAKKKKILQIDTAPSYGFNNSVEKLLGASLFGLRKNFFISSKFTNNRHLTKKKRILNLRLSLNNTLKNLKTNYIDNYFFHSGDDENFFDDDLWKYLISLKKKKIVRRLGLSLKHDYVKKNLLSQLFSAKKYGIDLISTVLNIYSKEAILKVIPYCKKNKIEVWARMPLGRGLLTGKYKSVNELNFNDKRRVEEYKISQRVISFSKKNRINTKKALLWCLKNSNKVIIGFSEAHQLTSIIKQNQLK
jgi:aryl-alcohol dehydrogenase-like predicted oxidoreductase